MLAPVKILFDKSIDYFNTESHKVKRIYPKYSYINQYTSFFKKPTHIIDNIYLGSAFNSACYYQLINLKITTIINITKELTNHYPYDFIYHKYAIHDNDLDNINIYLTDIYNQIINTSGNILIHCFMGASRSVSAVIFYLMTKHKMTLNEAVLFIQKKRSIINLSETLYANLKN